MKLILSGVTGSGVETIARVIAVRLHIPAFRGDDLGYRSSSDDEKEWLYRDEALNLRRCHIRGTKLDIPENEHGLSAIIPITDGSDVHVVQRLARLNPRDLIIRCIAPDMFELTRRRNIWRAAHHLPILAYDGVGHDLHPNDATFLGDVPPCSEFVTNNNMLKSVLEILEICGKHCSADDKLRAATAFFKRTPPDLLTMPLDRLDTMLSCIDHLKSASVRGRQFGSKEAQQVLICDAMSQLLHQARCEGLLRNLELDF